MNYGEREYLYYFMICIIMLYAISIIYIVIIKRGSKMSESCPGFFSSGADFVLWGRQ